MSGLLERMTKGGERSEGGDWIITFADLMTLLFCFFVLLTTLSTAPKNCAGLVNYFEENRFFVSQRRGQTAAGGAAEAGAVV